MDYLVVKSIHHAAVALSFAGFFARGLASLRGARWVRGRAARSLPHVVDTVLLASAVTLAWTAAINPLHAPWLMAKIIGLLVYIGLGMVALRPAFAPALRLAAWLAALVTFAYIVSVAISKNVLGPLAWF
jgi:uncharacterized membrane protein SirB2